MKLVYYDKYLPFWIRQCGVDKYMYFFCARHSLCLYIVCTLYIYLCVFTFEILRKD